MDHPAEQKPLRLFCAVELPPEVRARAAAHAASLRPAGEGAQAKVGWEREEKLHATLKFFGDVKPARLDALTDALARAAARTCAFASSLEGCGVFPNSARPHVLWLGVADEEGLFAAVWRSLEDECAAANFPRDARPLHPHVTLARVRAINSAARTLARKHLETHFEPAPFDVSALVLMRSELGARGSTYTGVSRHKLEMGAGG
ncbi:MAG: RNA 2',3'-cyclic phosphodiesterase [Acidobacteria bacterium]|nr:RNA 2',3'-cyclic phosphodiesterase [Acidobacteriota bacterium]